MPPFGPSIVVACGHGYGASRSEKCLIVTHDIDLARKMSRVLHLVDTASGWDERHTLALLLALHYAGMAARLACRNLGLPAMAFANRETNQKFQEKLQLHINASAAQKMGVSIPAALRIKADKIYE